MSQVKEVKMNVICKPFSSFARGQFSVLVELGDYPRVRVWDSLGKLYTVCHSLSERSQRSIIARARKVA